MILKRLALLLALPATLALTAPADAAFHPGAGSIGVYQLNIGKMGYTWPDWVSYIKEDAQAPIPDVILGQDFESVTEIDQFRDYISASWGFGTNYTYAQRPAANNHVVIFWRTARFTSSKDRGWKGYGGLQGDPNCVPGADNAQAVQVRLWDTVAAKFVGAVSMKTPPKDATSDCARMNMDKATTELNRNDGTVGEWRGDLRLVGTDANAPDYRNGAYECWWDRVVAADPGPCGTSTDLGWSDVIYDLCLGVRVGCLDNHWTRNQSRTRIDFLFAKRPAGTAVSTNHKTVGQYDCTKFSDHCSPGAAVWY